MLIRFIGEVPLPREIIGKDKGRAFLASARRGSLMALGRGLARARGELNVVWSSRGRVRALNRRFRNVRRFTDVIAFRYEDSQTFGDLFIAVPQAAVNARRFGVPLREELLRLVVHGTLHLVGYTDYAPRERKKMWAIQERILKRLNALP